VGEKRSCVGVVVMIYNCGFKVDTGNEEEYGVCTTAKMKRA
jgi:hypothetical protein